MAEISASLVKELRERTGLGMMECKKALVEAGGDIETAADNLRKSGAAKADKKAGRTAAEGAVIIATAGNTALMIEINSETDFVAKDDNFQRFAKGIASVALAAKETDVEKIKVLKLESGSVEEARAALVQKIGENVQIRGAVLVLLTGLPKKFPDSGVGAAGGASRSRSLACVPFSARAAYEAIC